MLPNELAIITDGQSCYIECEKSILRPLYISIEYAILVLKKYSDIVGGVGHALNGSLVRKEEYYVCIEFVSNADT